MPFSTTNVASASTLLNLETAHSIPPRHRVVFPLPDMDQYPAVGPRVPKDEFMRALGLDHQNPNHENYYRQMRVRPRLPSGWPRY
jgi:hypothetical protein